MAGNWPAERLPFLIDELIERAGLLGAGDELAVRWGLPCAAKRLADDLYLLAQPAVMTSSGVTEPLLKHRFALSIMLDQRDVAVPAPRSRQSISCETSRPGKAIFRTACLPECVTTSATNDSVPTPQQRPTAGTTLFRDRPPYREALSATAPQQRPAKRPSCEPRQECHPVGSWHRLSISRGIASPRPSRAVPA